MIGHKGSSPNAPKTARNGRAAPSDGIVDGGLRMEKSAAVHPDECYENSLSRAHSRNPRLTSPAYHPRGYFSVLKVLHL
jgi:hypothetical protein